SVDDVIAEMTWAKGNLGDVREFFFDDDTFSFEKERTREIARRLKPLGITWGGNARGNLDYETLRIMKEGGARNLVDGYESAAQQILNNVKRGIGVERYVDFTQSAKRAGLMIHGAFILAFRARPRGRSRRRFGSHARSILTPSRCRSQRRIQ